MKLTKVIPQVVKIDTDLIKVNDIFNVTDTLGTYGQRNYIVVNVTNDIIVLRSLEAKKDSELIIRVEDVDRYKFKKMKLVEDIVDKSDKNNTSKENNNIPFDKMRGGMGNKTIQQILNEKQTSIEKQKNDKKRNGYEEDYAEHLLKLLFGIDSVKIKKNDKNCQ